MRPGIRGALLSTSAGTVLRARPGVVIRVKSDGVCDIDAPGGRIRVPAVGLAVVAVFSRPRPLAEGIAALETQVAGHQGALELLSTVMTLRSAGVLEGAADLHELQFDAMGEGFAALPSHAALLADGPRTLGWLRALRRAVRPEQVVLEIGAGTGILSTAAALAGARRVFAVESTDVAGVAARVADGNRVGDVVQLVHGWSTAIALSEPADLLVSEILDDDPFQEGVLEATADARQRHLLPGATVIPSRIRLLGVPAELAPEELERHAVTPELLQRWRDQYGIELASLIESMGVGYVVNLLRKHTATWTRLGPPVVLADVDFATDFPTALSTVSELQVSAEGVCHAVLTYFEAQLDEESAVTTDPLRGDGATSWRNPVFVLARPRRVRAGDSLRLAYRYPGSPSLELLP